MLKTFTDKDNELISIMVSINNLSIRYKDHQIIKDLNLSLNNGELFSLLGKSGSGKSSILRFIAGLDECNDGLVELDKKMLSVEGKHIIKPGYRGIGMVFQDYSLFPHMNIASNISFGIYKQDRITQKQRVKELLSLINLERIEEKYPHQLSGGEQQRVALARALAPSPKILLLDEPFSNLDDITRKLLVKQIRDILKKTNTISILVTHSQMETEIFSSRVGIINHKTLEEK